MFKHLVLLQLTILLCLGPIVTQAQEAGSGFDIELSRKRCDSQAGTHGTLPATELYQSDVHWGYSLSEMEADFWSIYKSGKRLRHPAEFDPSSGTFRTFRKGMSDIEPIKLTDRFIKNVTLHIEEALKNGFADFVFFPDMGHSHLYFEQKIWDDRHQAVLSDNAKDSMSRLYVQMLADPDLYALYHTAEQLEMMIDKTLLDDPYLQFRYWNRNPMGKHDESGLLKPMPVKRDDGFNTVRELPGLKRWSGGFEVSSSKNGCFAYRAKNGDTLFFDIGLTPLQMDPNRPVTEERY